MLKDLFTVIIAFVKAAETAYPDAGKGKEKFQLVADQILAFAPLIGLALDTATALMPVFQGFVSATVTYFNKSGVFKTTPVVVPSPKPSA